MFVLLPLFIKIRVYYCSLLWLFYDYESLGDGQKHNYISQYATINDQRHLSTLSIYAVRLMKSLHKIFCRDDMRIDTCNLCILYVCSAFFVFC